MPRKKKNTETKMSKAEVREAFVSARLFTQDQIKATLFEVCAREDLPEDTVKRVHAVIDTVVSNSISKVMASVGL